MVGKRGRSPEQGVPKKMPRFEMYGPRYPPYVSRPGILSNSASSSRQSSRSRTTEPETRPLRREASLFAAAVENLVQSSTLRSLKHEQLTKVASDHEEMEPKCSAFPALLNYKTQRLKNAEQDMEAARASTGGFAEKVSDALLECLALTEMRKEPDTHHIIQRLDKLETENSDLRQRVELMEILERRVGEMTRRLEPLENLGRRIDEIARRLDIMESLGKRVDENARHTEEVHSTLNKRIEKSELFIRQTNKEKETTLQDMDERKKQRHEDQAKQSQLNELIHQCDRKITKISNDVEKINNGLESLRGNIDNLPRQSLQTTTPSLGKDLQNLKHKVDCIEEQLNRVDEKSKANDSVIKQRIVDIGKEIKRIDEESAEKDDIIDGDMQDVKKAIEDNHKKTDLSMTGLETRVQDLEGLKANLNKDAKTQTALDALESNYIAVQKLVKEHGTTIGENIQRTDAQVKMIEQHEYRLNHMTTDEMVAMMINQWAQYYPPPNQMKLFFNQTKLDIQKLKEDSRRLQTEVTQRGS